MTGIILSGGGKIMKKKPVRIILIILAAVLALAAIGAVIFKAFSGRKYDSAHFGIAVYKSQVDADGDGIDDQTDILLSVKDYLATKPVYKSAYYSGGYPDDGYGVCTDVVAFGLLGAGYDLQKLVDADRAANPGDYSANEVPDSNIDFRRVRNLLPYFRNNAIELTRNIFNTDEWQPGDIVIFEGHIGVISEHRNFLGIPYVYHHGSVDQKAYEEDILMRNQSKILGHFRVS